MQHLGIEPGQHMMSALFKRDRKRKRETNTNAIILAKKLENPEECARWMQDEGKRFTMLKTTTPRYPNYDSKPFDSGSEVKIEAEEEWNKTPNVNVYTRISGKYQGPPSTPLNFYSKQKWKPQNVRNGIFSNKGRMRLQIFKVQNWLVVSPRQPSTGQCLEELKKRYITLSQIQKSNFNTP